MYLHEALNGIISHIIAYSLGYIRLVEIAACFMSCRYNMYKESTLLTLKIHLGQNPGENTSIPFFEMIAREAES
jgi:hypothetical protein